MKKPLAINIAKARASLGFSQEYCSKRCKIARSNWGAYEENRATPNPETLVKILNLFRIKDIEGFITDPNFPMPESNTEKLPIPTQVQRHYEDASLKDKLAVNIILGLVDVEN